MIRHSTQLLALALVFFFALIPGCASQRRARYDAAVAADLPPADFWLSVTVLRAPADTASRAAAYQRIPVARRPASYVIEADRILRAAVGSGAADDTFPVETRQLTESEFRSIWATLRTSSLVLQDHPAMVGRVPQVSSIGSATLYIVSFSINGDRRTLALEADPHPAPSAPDAAKLVEQLGTLAWLK